LRKSQAQTQITYDKDDRHPFRRKQQKAILPESLAKREKAKPKIPKNISTTRLLKSIAPKDYFATTRKAKRL